MTRSLSLSTLALLLPAGWALAQTPAPAQAPPVSETQRSILPTTLQVPELGDIKLPMPRTVRAANALLGMTRQRLALVVGNGVVDGDVKLATASRDTQAVAAALRAGGFVVMVREDLGADDLRANLKEFQSRLQPGGVGLLYFTGLAAQVEGRNYVLPRGLRLQGTATPAQLKQAAVPLQEIVDAVQGTAESPRYLIVDAGSSHPALAGLGSVGLAEQKLPPGLMGLFSSTPGTALAPAEPFALPLPAATDPRQLAASPFGREFVRSLVTPRISGPDVLRLTRGAVLDVSAGKQAPLIVGDNTSKDELAEPNLLDALFPRSPEEMAREALKQALRGVGSGDVPVAQVAQTSTASASQLAEMEDGKSNQRRAPQTPKASVGDTQLPDASSAAGSVANAAVGAAANAAVGAAANAAAAVAVAAVGAQLAATTATAGAAAAAASTAVGLATSVASLAAGSNSGTSTPPNPLVKPASVALPAAPPAAAAPAPAPAPAPVQAAAPAPTAVDPLPAAAPRGAVPQAFTAADAAAAPAARLATPAALAQQLVSQPADARTQRQQTGGERPAYVPRVNPYGYAEGDTFMYRVLDTWKDQVLGSMVQTVDEVREGGELIANGHQTEMDPQGRVKSTHNLDGSTSQFEPYQDLWWSNPKRGESRSVKFSEYFQRADRSRGETEWKGSLSVGRLRKIQLPAGEFEVLPIEGSGWFYEKMAGGQRASGQWSRTVWYAPKLGHPVAIDIEDANAVGKLLRRERIELTHAQTARTSAQ